ncbi:cortical protein marker for cell polarity-domain-containing protein [Parasitella parasitica]|nr:cortical protein marker for cell polarity-domain-containing protein [Parasitella parasitica]
MTAGLFYILLSAAINICLASFVTHPNINFDPVERLGISGSYSGISLYKDTKQLTQIPRSTSSVVSLSNDTLRLIASSNINGSIYDACMLSNKLFIAGNFSTIKGQSVNNIASIDLKINQLRPLKYGLDGPVHSLYCDTANQQLYVGGSFIAPVDISMINYSDSLSQFGGGIALWKNDQWQGLPWKGVNGPVYSIIKSNKNSMLFAGEFNATTDGQPYHAPATQPIRLSSASVTATNTASNSATPGSIVCADVTNASPWILSDGVKGTWQVTFLEYSVNPVLIRISNSKLRDHQTNQFSIRSLTDATTYQLSYFDPDTNLTKTCSTNCSLSNNTNVLHQDFRITNISLASGIAIDINSWYGVGGGLASVKVFQSEIFAYAVDPPGTNICAPTTITNNNTLLPKISAVGDWASSNTSIPYLLNQVSKADLASPPSVTFYPNIAESGIYQVLLYSPGCATDNCVGRTDVDATVSASPFEKPNTTTVTPSSVLSQSIFTGYFVVSSSFTPSVRLELGKNTTFSGNATMTFAAHAVQFIKIPSVDALSSIIQYNISKPVINATSIPWGQLPDAMSSNSIVKSMALSSDGVYIAGSFTGTDKSKTKYTNVVKYDTNIGQLKALQNEGVGGTVESLVCTDNELYVGGSFAKLAGTNTTSSDNLSNVARYDIQKGTWSALHGGVDGPVKAMNWIKDKQSIVVSGEFSQLLKTSNEAYSNSTAGTAIWSTERNLWDTTSDIPYLSGVVYSIINFNKNDYFIGSIKSAQRYQSRGISFISKDSTLSPFDAFYPGGSSNSSIRVGVLYTKEHTASKLAKRDVSTESSNSTHAAIFGGQFTLSGNIQNVAIYENGVWSGVQGADWQGTINTMAVNNDLLYVGGRFTGPSSNNLAVFNLSSKALSLGPEVKTLDGSPASVNIIRHVSSQNTMIVGGNFTSVGSMPCSSICSINTTSLQWSTLGSGLLGQVSDVQFINGKLVAAGNISLNNSPLAIAEYDFANNTWGPFGTADLPGPSSSISYNSITKQVYVSGQSSDAPAAAYIRIWDGQQFIAPRKELGPGSSIAGLSMLPVITANSSAQSVLLVSGFINLGELGNVSAAFFDGDEWTPYLVTSDANGDVSSGLNSIFYVDPALFFTSSLNAGGSMAQPLVIIVSIAISLGIVFLIVLLCMLYVYFKRKRDSKINPQTNPNTYYGNPPRSPKDIIASLKANTLDDEKYEKEDGGNEKSRHLQPENQQLYNMSKSLSQERLHEQTLSPYNNTANSGAVATTTARAAPLPPTAHPRSFAQNPHQHSTNYQSPNSNETIISSPAVSHDAGRSETFANPYGSSQRSSNNGSFYNNEYTTTPNREMFEFRRFSPFNPFRSSEIGLAISGDESIVASGAAAAAFNNNHDNSRSSPTSSERSLPQTVTYSNIAPPETSTIAVTPAPENVRWTNASSANAAKSTAVVKPISFVRSSGGSSSLIDPVYGPGAVVAEKAEKVRWTKAPSSKDAVGTAIVIPAMPPVPTTHSSEDVLMHANQNSATANSYKAPASNVRWTNCNTEGAVGVATVEPVVSNELYDNYPLEKPAALTKSSLYNSFQSGGAFSSDPAIARWTNAPSAEKNKAVATIELVEPNEDNSDNSNSYNVSQDKTKLGLSSIAPTPRLKNDSTLYAGTVMNADAFRLSDAGSLAPIDTARQDTETDDSAVRWKTAKAGSPIETVHAPLFVEPASAMVTRRSAHVATDDGSLDEYYLSEASVPPTPTKKSDKFKPVVNTSHSSSAADETKLAEPIDDQVEVKDQGVPSHALDELRAFIDEETMETQQQQSQGNVPALTNVRATPSPSGVNALDGRAASKRMVEEYLTSKKVPNTEESTKARSKYKSDFKSVMQAAIENNTSFAVATENHPHLYYAKFEFSAREKGELGFEKGDPIIVVDSSDDIWWFGYKAAKSDGSFVEGVFPSNYVEMALSVC